MVTYVYKFLSPNYHVADGVKAFKKRTENGQKGERKYNNFLNSNFFMYLCTFFLPVH